MKKIRIATLFSLLVGLTIYANNQYGLLSLVGMNGQGLALKAVTGDLKNITDSTALNVDHGVWDQLLRKHVDPTGFVDYKGFLADKKRLQTYLDALAELEPSNSWSVHEQLAYYINAYNAYTVLLILQNPEVKSIKDIDGAWTKDIVKIGAKKISLGALEHSVLRKMNEPRIHFAINCASGSCPMLRNEAFTAQGLDAQLESVAKGFVNSPNNTLAPDQVQLSKIFKWYKGDFMQGDLIAYINRYAALKIAATAKIRYKEYDWALNGSW